MVCVERCMSYERGDSVRERAGYGTTLSSTAFDAYEDDALGCSDACGGMGEGFDRPFDVSLWKILVLNEGDA